MSQQTITPRSQERQFQLDELFFSITDKKGIIRFGNEVFTRIAGYELAEMVGRPHNLIRHPDMPRTVFKLVWDYLQQGKPVVGYVKNLARDGCYYWVLAMIMPCEEGYLSIRLKPTSEIFSVIQQAYAALLETEKQIEAQGKPGKDQMKAGETKLAELLDGLGFKSYDQFMWAALSAEMTSRQSQLAQQPGARSAQPVIDASTSLRNSEGSRFLTATLRDCIKLDEQLSRLFTRLETFSRLGEQVIPQSRFILNLGESIRLLSMNAEVESVRLGSYGAALGVVAERMGFHTDESNATISQLNDHLNELADPTARMMFNLIVSKLKVEMVCVFLREALDRPDRSASLDPDVRRNIHLLLGLFCETADQVMPAIQQLQSRLKIIDDKVSQLQRFIHTLSFIHFTGTVEATRTEEARTFVVIFQQVHQQIDQAKTQINDFLRLIHSHTSQISAVERLDEPALARLHAASRSQTSRLAA